ncbi:sensor histidine kinase [Alicyclobacillus fructus]|uniref:sensor histidine kinase n=1 Tax=Alicyclobacillus fructus TaxID=2816082 RepID=UPI001A8C235C|nr:sensor histidine kinase [Alicyclobacillus fructus]
MRRKLGRGAMETMIFFLLQLVYPASFLFGLPARSMAIGLAGLAAFGCLYAVTFFTPGKSAWRVAACLGQVAILLMLMAVFSMDYVYLLFYPVATMIQAPLRRTLAMLALLCASVGGLIAVRWAMHDLFPQGFVYLSFGTLFGGSVMIFMMRAWMALQSTNARLKAAQDEIARLSQAEERARIGRDLHDLLGHQLSLITLKAQVAGRLLERAGDVERARREIGQIEQVSRATLEAVRAYVADMRATDWGDAWRAAGEVFAAAGIHASMDCEIDRLPAEFEHAYAMCLREAVTNVVRHSGARRCAVRMWREADSLVLVVADDGAGGSGSSARGACGGSGISGMRARMAQIGGVCEVLSGHQWRRQSGMWPEFEPGWVVMMRAPVPRSEGEGVG